MQTLPLPTQLLDGEVVNKVSTLPRKQRSETCAILDTLRDAVPMVSKKTARMMRDIAQQEQTERNNQGNNLHTINQTTFWEYGTHQMANQMAYCVVADAAFAPIVANLETLRPGSYRLSEQRLAEKTRIACILLDSDRYELVRVRGATYLEVRE